MSDGTITITVDFTVPAGTQTTATVERGPSASGPWTLLDTVDLLGQMGTYTDTSPPLDTPVWYRWTGSPGGAVFVQGPFTTLSDGKVFIKDPLRPWSNLSLSFCGSSQQALSVMCAPQAPDLVWVGLGDLTYEADANLFNVYQAAVPADVFGRRKRLNGSLSIFSKTLAAAQAVEELFTGGGPLQLQLPPVYGWADAFIQPGDVTESYRHPDQRKPIRLWTAPFVVVDRPVGPQQGTFFANWCVVAEVFDTFADLTASGYTWAQVASGEAVSGEPALDGYGEGLYGDGPYGD